MNFDTTPKQTLFLMILVIGLYIVATIPELFTPECTGVGDCFDFDRRMARLAVWDIDWFQTDFRHVLHMGLLSLSYNLFGNYKVLVLTSSVLLLVVTWLFAKQLTGKNFVGLVSVLVLISSTIFHNYDTSVTYPSFWALLFLMSVYLVSGKQFLSPLPFLLSIPAKSLTALFLPGLLAYLWIEDKMKLFLVYVGIIAVGFFLILAVDQFNDKESGGFLLFSKIDHFDFEKFFMGFVSWMWKGFGSDQITLMILVVFGFLLFSARKRIEHASSILALSGSMVLISPILTGMTTYDIWPYRMLPLVCFTSIIVGMVVANLDKINFRMFLVKA